MRIVSSRRDDGAARFGIVDGETMHDAGGDLLDRALRAVVGRLDDVPLRAPVPRPGKVV
jgi:hypothetical protein